LGFFVTHFTVTVYKHKYSLKKKTKRSSLRWLDVKKASKKEIKKLPEKLDDLVVFVGSFTFLNFKFLVAHV